jgi:hypothetical protein
LLGRFAPRIEITPGYAASPYTLDKVSHSPARFTNIKK